MVSWLFLAEPGPHPFALLSRLFCRTSAWSFCCFSFGVAACVFSTRFVKRFSTGEGLDFRAAPLNLCASKSEPSSQQPVDSSSESKAPSIGYPNPPPEGTSWRCERDFVFLVPSGWFFNSSGMPNGTRYTAIISAGRRCVHPVYHHRASHRALAAFSEQYMAMQTVTVRSDLSPEQAELHCAVLLHQLSSCSPDFESIVKPHLCAPLGYFRCFAAAALERRVEGDLVHHVNVMYHLLSGLLVTKCLKAPASEWEALCGVLSDMNELMQIPGACVPATGETATQLTRPYC